MPTSVGGSIDLSAAEASVMAVLFAANARVVIDGELGRGFSGARVLRLTPYRDTGTPELPTVVKIGASDLVRQEFDAYRRHIRGRLSGIPEVWGDPAYSVDGTVGGLRYDLVGAGLFEFVSLARYAQTASPADLAHVLASRLFVHLSTIWRQSRVVADAPLGETYMGFLAPDRTARFASALAGTGLARSRAVDPTRAAGGSSPANEHPPDLSAPTVAVPTGAALSGAVLPNPLAALPVLLAAPMPHRVATIHGDLNLENVLVDPDARTVRLIDFSHSREDHVLYDLLQLETGLVTRLLPGSLAEAGLHPPDAVDLYRRLHTAVAAGTPVPTLQAVYIGLAAIRQSAIPLLADPADWREYLVGLAACLVGAGTDHNLDATAKATAFWAAAAALDLAASRPAVDVAALARAIPTLLSRDPVLDAYRRGRIAEWTGPRHELDERFVELTLLVDQGEESASGRWQTREVAHASLRQLLDSVADPALVVLGSPGCGKSTLLQRLELELALAGLERDATGDPGRLTFFLPLNLYRPADPGGAPPPPLAWLAAQWAARFPDLPPLGNLLREGRMILLLDALNEIPAASAAEARQRVGLWRDLAQEIAATATGSRIVFSCRSLDYSTPLSTSQLRVPQVRIEPLSDAQVQAFLAQYLPQRADALWAALARSGHLDVVRSPYFLRLLVEQVEATGHMPFGRAALFTGFVRQALTRELERDHPLLRPDTLLTASDVRRLTAARGWPTPYDLPEHGVLVPKLGELAFRMQGRSEVAGEAAQVRVNFDTALDLLDHPRDADIVAAGTALGVLDEDLGLDEVLFAHQLIQEYFASRILARTPRPELVARPWRAADAEPPVRTLLATLPPAEMLPPLPQTGWEETVLLATVMAPDPAAFIRGVMATHLALAGRCAAQVAGAREPVAPGSEAPHGSASDGSPLERDLRAALVARSRDPQADLRDRIACALAAGDLGDPRFARQTGPFGDCLMPPLIEIPAGAYPIGTDEPIAWRHRGTSGAETDHMPRHFVPIAAFRIGQYPVTNAEYACFMAAGGYEHDRWWDTVDGRRWRRGDLANTAAKTNNWQWRRRFQETPGLFDQMADEGQFGSETALAQWRVWMTYDDAAFAAEMETQWPAKRVAAPEYWRNARWNRPNQPVVGVTWYEARAYCRWLTAQTGLPFRLPTEVEWEAAAAGPTGRAFPWGADEDALRANTHETRLWVTTPVGVLAEGDTPEGVADLGGNISEWTSTLWGAEGVGAAPPFAYPYDPLDGREDPEAGPDVIRVARGGAYSLPAAWARCAFRGNMEPEFQINTTGFRVACSAAGVTLPAAPPGTADSRPPAARAT